MLFLYGLYGYKLRINFIKNINFIAWVASYFINYGVKKSLLVVVLKSIQKSHELEVASLAPLSGTPIGWGWLPISL
jgi:hypothetical protein